MNLLSKIRRYRVPILVLCVLLWATAFVLTHVPGPDMPHLAVGDKVLHTAGYFGLAMLLLVTLAAYRVARAMRIAVALAAMLCYGILDEYTQQFFGRSTDFGDLMVDMLGIYLAVLLGECVLVILELKARGASPNADT